MITLSIFKLFIPPSWRVTYGIGGVKGNSVSKLFGEIEKKKATS